MKKIFLVAGLSLLLGGCIGLVNGQENAFDFDLTPASREAYVAKHLDLPAEFADKIKKGEIQVGMKIDEIRAAWGEPTMEKSRKEKTVFGYYFGKILTFRDGILINIEGNERSNGISLFYTGGN